MAARDFDLPVELEAALQSVCAENHVPERFHDELRSLVTQPPSCRPARCHGSCNPCVADQAALAREILQRAQIA